MSQNKIKKIIERLLEEVQEEDIVIHLLSGHYQDADELSFFSDADQAKVLGIMNRLHDDSLRHKGQLKEIIEVLEGESA